MWRPGATLAKMVVRRNAALRLELREGLRVSGTVRGTSTARTSRALAWIEVIVVKVGAFRQTECRLRRMTKER